ncbi:MAG: translation elongation factor Ts, partial [Proteobacteria bacterium]|nr:translation elongation factor Ts [Pseudomonadota bacterium]
MAEITASLVKELRERTGAGMMDCKKALTESGGDLSAAADWLRTKGLAAAAKKASRVAAEGLVGVVSTGTEAAVVEVNSETDFVARNEDFQAFVSQAAKIALDKRGVLDDIAAADYPGTDRTVEAQVTHLVSTLGENLSFRRSGHIAI